jgi:hypothetical protein
MFEYDKVVDETADALLGIQHVQQVSQKPIVSHAVKAVDV